MPRTLATPYAVYTKPPKVFSFFNTNYHGRVLVEFAARQPSCLLWQDTHRQRRLLTSSLPPLLLGMMWSTCAALPLTTRKHTRHW